MFRPETCSLFWKKWKNIVFILCSEDLRRCKCRGREQSESFRGSEVSDWEVRKKKLKTEVRVNCLFKNVKQKNTNRQKVTCVDHFHRRNKQNKNIQPLSTSLKYMKLRRSLPLILQNNYIHFHTTSYESRIFHLHLIDCSLVSASQCIWSCRDGACLSSTHFLYRGFTACHHCLVKAVHSKRCEHTISKRSILLYISWYLLHSISCIFI